jgi:hypothetical protein
MTTLPMDSLEPRAPRIDRRALYVLAILLLALTTVFAYNMFQYPYFQDAEGTNLSKSWALLQTGELSPYTYTYDEPPLASILLGLWGIVTRATTAFDLSLESGRLLMLVCHVAATAFLFGIARKTSKSVLTAGIVTLIFALSPLVVALQRRILVDNVMLVGLLAAFYLIVGDYRRLKNFIISAVCFGLAVLSKDGAIFFLPAFIYTVRLQADAYHRRFAVTLWWLLAVMLITLYPLYAHMKQELFPQGWLLGGDFEHVSLIEALSDRGPDTGTFLNFGSGLSDSFQKWTDVTNPIADPILIYGGMIGFFFVVLMAFDNRRLRSVVAMTLAAGLYLLVGGRMSETSVLFIAPFLALVAGTAIGALVRGVGRLSGQPVVRFLLGTVALAVLLYPFAVYYSTQVAVYTVDQVAGQREAVAWIETNVPNDAVIVTDNYAFVELRANFPGVEHYFRVETDPEIKYLLLNDDVCNIDYILTTPQVIQETNTYSLDLVVRALNQSEVLVSYDNNGWPVEIRQVNKSNCALDALS